jgi:phospholipid/cholesterol/gamma-HCH transport system ATP-binding protein
MTATAPAQGVSVRVRGLEKTFDAQPVLHGIDLDIQAGELFVLMGPSGAGKSIFLRHLIRLETADRGEIRFNDVPVADETIRDQFRLAMVFQSGGLLNSLTVAENVGLYLREHRLKPQAEIDRIVREKLALVHLQEGDARKYPIELSGGMKKRVAIARALVTDPQLVLYDEPTSELDPLVALTVGREILRANHHTGATTIVVTHDRDLAFGIAHRIAFLADGRILAVGTPAQIRASTEPLIQRFLAADFSQE